MKFKRNLGPWDRAFRIILGLGLVFVGYNRLYSLPAWGIWLFYLLGLSQIVEGAAGY